MALLPAMRALADLTRGHQEVAGTLRVSFEASGTRSTSATTLGDYTVVKEIGRGGMGIVYEAEQLSLGRQVALKVLPFAGMLDERTLTRFRNEARAAATLNHPNIVPIIGSGEERGVYYYAMQLIRGCTLADYIGELRSGIQGSGFGVQEDKSRNPTAPPRADTHAITNARTLPLHSSPTQPSQHFRRLAEIGIQVAEALDHAHARGIVHRDIKPSNLLLDENGKVWVTDFGLAAIEGATQLTMTGDLLGTLRFMSPEQATAQHGVLDHRTDVYSLGVTLYELVTLQPAFGQTERVALLKQILETDPIPARRVDRLIPQDLETIIAKAVCKESSHRYRTAQEMADDLRRFLEDKPIHAQRASLVQRAQKWSRRHKAAIGSAGAIALIIACLLIFTSVRQANTSRRTAGMVRESLTAVATAIEARDLDLAARRMVEAKARLGANPAHLPREAAAVERVGGNSRLGSATS